MSWLLLVLGEIVVHRLRMEEADGVADLVGGDVGEGVDPLAVLEAVRDAQQRADPDHDRAVTVEVTLIEMGLTNLEASARDDVVGEEHRGVVRVVFRFAVDDHELSGLECAEKQFDLGADVLAGIRRSRLRRASCRRSGAWWENEIGPSGLAATSDSPPVQSRTTVLVKVSPLSGLAASGESPAGTLPQPAKASASMALAVMNGCL